MKKIKFFLNPIDDLEKWLNCVADNGYRLKSIKNFLYEFEKTDKRYSYTTQFIGANTSRENNEYIQMLKENGTRVYRAPLNQGNIVFGKVRLRPYAHGDGKIANSFQGYNKEILVVENVGKGCEKLLTNKEDLADLYKNIKNAYLQGTILLWGLLIYILYSLFTDYTLTETILGLILLPVTLFYSMIFFKANRNYRKYKAEAEIIE